MEELSNQSLESRSNAVDDQPAEADTAATIESLAAARDQALAEKDDLYDRLLRKQAEFENFRRRMAREKEEILQFAAMETIRALLPILDDFERALKSPATGDDYRKGVELIYRRLYDTLSQMGLSPIEAQGKKFDPHYHQAVDTVKMPDHEDQSIIEEFQKGYDFKGRLLRPAMVKVAVRE